MEVFRANLQLLEEQGLLSPDQPPFQAPAGPRTAKTPPPNPNPNTSQQRPSPPKSIADPSIHNAVHSPNITQPTHPDLNNTQHPIFTQINNNNNNNVAAMKAYGQLPIFHGGFPAEQHGGYPMLGAPAMVQATAAQVGQLAPGHQQLAATGLLFASPQALRPALQIATHPQPQPQPLLLTNKLKAQPSLISIPSPRDHKFMPY